jgi:hypothetical protein
MTLHHEVVDTDDTPLVTFEGICDALQMLLVVLGVVAAAVAAWLYQAGFFHWIAKSFPNGLLAQIIGV